LAPYRHRIEFRIDADVVNNPSACISSHPHGVIIEIVQEIARETKTKRKGLSI